MSTDRSDPVPLPDALSVRDVDQAGGEVQLALEAIEDAIDHLAPDDYDGPRSDIHERLTIAFAELAWCETALSGELTQRIDDAESIYNPAYLPGKTSVT